MHHMDVKSAFLIGELQEDVFVEQEDLSITSPPLPVVLVIHAQGYLQIDRHVFFFACFVFSLTCAEHQLVVCRAFRRPWCWTSSPTSTPASEYPDRQTPDEKKRKKKRSITAAVLYCAHLSYQPRAANICYDRVVCYIKL